MHQHPPLGRDYNRDPHVKALDIRGFISHGSTLWFGFWGLAFGV